VTFQALADGSSVAEAKASAAGADKEKEGSGGKSTADDQTAKQTSLANNKSGKDNEVGQDAETSDGAVSVAAAIGVNVAKTVDSGLGGRRVDDRCGRTVDCRDPGEAWTPVPKGTVARPLIPEEHPSESD
jgi:hypothetical protein